MNTTDQRVTVVIAAFQAEAFIATAVRSALAQQPQPAEVIVVDDQSSDATAEVARAAGARVITLASNQGPGAARAVGFAASTSPWIAWLDADDVYLPGHLARLLLACPGHVLVADTAIGSHSGRWYGWPGRRPLQLRSPRRLIPENPIVLSSAMASRAALEKIDGFAVGRYSEDLRTWLLLLEAGSGVVVPQAGVVYGEHSGQATASAGMIASGEQVYAEFVDRSWYQPRQLAALRVVTAWDTDRGSIRRHVSAWPALFRFLLNRRRTAMRRTTPPLPV